MMQRNININHLNRPRRNLDEPVRPQLLLLPGRKPASQANRRAAMRQAAPIDVNDRQVQRIQAAIGSLQRMGGAAAIQARPPALLAAAANE